MCGKDTIVMVVEVVLRGYLGGWRLSRSRCYGGMAPSAFSISYIQKIYMPLLGQLDEVSTDMLPAIGAHGQVPDAGA